MLFMGQGNPRKICYKFCPFPEYESIGPSKKNDMTFLLKT